MNQPFHSGGSAEHREGRSAEVSLRLRPSRGGQGRRSHDQGQVEADHVPPGRSRSTEEREGKDAELQANLQGEHSVQEGLSQRTCARHFEFMMHDANLSERRGRAEMVCELFYLFGHFK